MVASPTPAGIYTLSSILLATSAACVCLRYKARRMRANKWGADDWLVMLAALLQSGLAINLIYGATQGTIGTHTQLNPETGAVIQTPHEVQIAKASVVSNILIIFGLGILKSGVVMFYRRIFIGDKFRVASLSVVVLLALWTTGFFFTTILECNGHNLNFLWKSPITFKQQCQKYKTVQLAHAGSDVITDLIILSLPLPSIWKLHMSNSRKILISLIFLVGFLSVAAATARLVIVAEDLVETTPVARDVRGVTTNVLVWSYVEVGVGIVAACLPTLKPIFDDRSVDSIVASVRSKVSLASLRSKASNAQNGNNNLLKGPHSLELDHVDSSPPKHTYRQMQEPDGISPLNETSAV